MRMRIACTIATLSLLAAALTGCAAEESLGSPDIHGIISVITLAETGGGGTLLVINETAVDTEYDQAYISVGEDVEIADLDGKRVSFDELSPFTEIEVWFAGPVAESYPVQATAKHIEVVGYDVP